MNWQWIFNRIICTWWQNYLMFWTPYFRNKTYKEICSARHNTHSCPGLRTFWSEREVSRTICSGVIRKRWFWHFPRHWHWPPTVKPPACSREGNRGAVEEDFGRYLTQIGALPAELGQKNDLGIFLQLSCHWIWTFTFQGQNVMGRQRGRCATFQS